MSKGVPRHSGGHRFNKWAANSAAELAQVRGELDGMDASDERFDDTLTRAIRFGSEVLGLAMRADPGRTSHRAAMARMMTQCTVPQLEGGV
jgi:hypothetical protein